MWGGRKHYVLLFALYLLMPLWSKQVTQPNPTSKKWGSVFYYGGEERNEYFAEQ